MIITRSILTNFLRQSAHISSRAGVKPQSILKCCMKYPLMNKIIYNAQPKMLTNKSNYFLSIGLEEEVEITQFIKKQKMKLKMDMEFQSSTAVEESCYGFYPPVVDQGTAEDCFELGQVMIDYAQKMVGKNQPNSSLIIHNLNLQVIKCYGHITVAFGHLKKDNNEWADQELNKVQKEFQSIESKLHFDQKFLIVNHVVKILSLAEKEEKCKFLVKYIINELQESFKDLEKLDENQVELAFESIKLYILSLMYKKNDEALKQLIEETNFLDIEYLYTDSLPIAYTSAGDLYSCIGYYFQKYGDKVVAFKYLKFASDIFEQVEGKDSHHYQYIQSQLEQLK